MNNMTTNILSTLNKNELEFLFRDGQQRFYAKDTLIIDAGDSGSSAYIIVSGKVKIFLDDVHGRKIVLSILKAGEYFGEMALIDQQIRSAKAITMEDTVLTEISKSVFRECLHAYPEVSERIMVGLVARLREATKKISNLALLSVHERVANMLRSQAREQDGMLVVEDKLTHQQIANNVGASREMVTRILKKMKIDGLIRIEGKKITLL